jgi:vanillin dehydrogenase
VVLKATEEAPISAGFFLAGLLRDAGLPAGVLNVITTPAANAEAVSRTLIDDPRVRRVNFTGSTRVGRKISQMAGNAMKRAVLELGGKNSLIVLADADLDYAVRAAAFSSRINGGQVCMSGDRIIVASEIAEEFAERLAERAGLRTGDPADPQTVIGPLISASAASRVAGMVDEAVGPPPAAVPDLRSLRVKPAARPSRSLAPRQRLWPGCGRPGSAAVHLAW